MPLPAQRTVTGLYTNPITGQPATGTVTFAPYPGTWTDTNGNQVMSGHQAVTLVNGAFSQPLVPTDTPAVFPTAGKLWRITEQLTGQPKNVWFFELETSASSIDITDLVELDPEPPPFVPEGTAGGDLVGSYPSPDLRNTQTARDHLGLGNVATLNVGTTAGTVAAGDDARIVGAAQKAANLSDLASAATSRTNLGLTALATAIFGTGAGQVTEGNDARVVGAAQKAQNLADLTNAVTARSNLGLGNVATRNIGLDLGEVQDAEPIGLSTGVITGGELNVNGSNPVALDIGATVGFIVDYATAPGSPTVTRVSIAAQTIALTDLVNPITWWLINSAGTVIQQNTRPTNSQRRTHIQLGATAQTGGVAILLEQSLPVTLHQPVNQFYDLLQALGAFTIDGNQIAAAGANLQFTKAAGTVFAASFNYFNGPTLTNDPHVSSTDAQAPVQFRYVFRNTNPIPPPITTLDPANYDVGGVLTLVPGGANNSTVQRVYLVPANNVSNQVVVQYGQNVYSSLNDAVAAAATESFVVNPTMASTGLLLGFIVMTKSATTLNSITQARFIQAAKFGTGATGSGTAVGTDSVGATRAVSKTADESVTASAVLQADNHLAVTVSANGVYTLEMFLDADGDPAGDLQMNFTFPAGASISWTEGGPVTGNTDNATSVKTSRITGATAGTVGIIAAGTSVFPKGVLRVGATGGTLQFQWAQAVSNGTATALRTGSWMRLHRIS